MQAVLADSIERTKIESSDEDFVESLPFELDLLIEYYTADYEHLSMFILSDKSRVCELLVQLYHLNSYRLMELVIFYRLKYGICKNSGLIPDLINNVVVDSSLSKFLNACTYNYPNVAYHFYDQLKDSSQEIFMPEMQIGMKIAMAFNCYDTLRFLLNNYTATEETIKELINTTNDKNSQCYIIVLKHLNRKKYMDIEDEYNKLL